MKICPQCHRVQLFKTSKCLWIDCQYIEGREIDKTFKPKNPNTYPKEIIMKFKKLI